MRAGRASAPRVRVINSDYLVGATYGGSTMNILYDFFINLIHAHDNENSSPFTEVESRGTTGGRYRRDASI